MREKNIFGAEKGLAMLTGVITSFGFYKVTCGLSHIVGGGARERFPLFKRGGTQKVLPCLEGGGGGHKSF